MKNPDQDQHRITKTYLKLWSFKDHANADTICVMKKGDPIAHSMRIKKFTTELNLFDTTVFDEGYERIFDEKCKYVENNYQQVINALQKNNYDPQIRIYLKEFVSCLLARQRKTYEFIANIIERKHLRDKILREITQLEDEKDVLILKLLFEDIATDQLHSLDSRVSAILLQVWKHFNIILDAYSHVILKAPEGRSWFTSDNPVIVQNFGKDGWLMGEDAEVYFPVSKEYTVYMFYKPSESKKEIKNLPIDKITQVSHLTHDEIMRKVICQSGADYFILNEACLYYNASTEEFEDGYKNIDKKHPHEYRTYFSLVDTPTPLPIDHEFIKPLLKKIGVENDPVVVPVKTHEEAIINECVAIVDRMVLEQGGKRILGWELREGPYLLEAEFHAVWESPSGELKDVAKKDTPRTLIQFLPDKRLVYEGKQINNIRINPYKIPLVDDLIEVSNQEFRLLNKGKRSRLYGNDLTKALSSSQWKNLQHVLKLKNLIFNFIKDGGNFNIHCPCQSGRLYKNCHHELIKGLKQLD